MSIRSGERCGNEIPNGILSFRAMRSFSGLDKSPPPRPSPHLWGEGERRRLKPLAPLAGRGRGPRRQTREGEGKPISDQPSHLLDQLHLRAVRGLDESDVAAVADLLQHDVRAVAAQF